MTHDNLNRGTVIKLRRDTGANWTIDNPVLEEGETGWETDTRRVKLGDGVTAWVDLPYAADEAASVTAETARAEAAEGVLQDNIDTEAATRAAADTALDGRVDTIETTYATDTDLAGEATTRATADSTLQTNINTEASTRGAADTALDTRLDTLEAAALVAPLPATSLLRAMSLGMYGNSYGAKTACAEYIYFDRLKSVIGSAVWSNSSVAGALAADQASFAFGTFTKLRQGTAAIASAATTGAGTYIGVVQTTAAILWVIDIARNDAGNDGQTVSGGTTAKSRAGFQNGLDSLIRLLRAQSIVDDPASATVVYTGAWTHLTTSSTYCSSGKQSYTTTNGDKVVFTQSGTDFDLVLIGQDASASGSTGSTFSVKVDGNAFTTGTSNNTTRKTGSGAGNFGVAQFCVPIRGLSAGSHTIELTHTGSAGHVLSVDCLLIPSVRPPTIIVNKTAELPAAGYAEYVALGGAGASAATDAIYNGIIDTVVAPFTGDSSVVVFDPMAVGFDKTTMIGTADGFHVHLNDVGQAFYASELLKIVRALQPRPGLVINT